jgi:voltage-gated potassium channel
MFKDLKNVILIVLLLFIGGSVGYSLIEDWNLFDSLYMTIITVSTTGYEEVFPLSTTGRVFTMILVIFGISFLFYALGNLNVFLFERNIFRNKKMQNRINRLSGHYIICGYGRIGKKIAQELEKRNKRFVVIEINDLHLHDIQESYLYLQADATEDQNLIKAGIENAVGLVAVMGSDASNMFTTLSARGLNNKLKIIAQAEEENSRQKLEKAGADRVILPYEIGGYRIIQALLRPTVLEYMDEIFSRSDIGLEFEEIKISENSEIANKSLADLSLRRELNIIIVGIYRAGTKWIYNPRSDAQLHAGDILIAIGETNDLSKMQKLAGIQ